VPSIILALMQFRKSFKMTYKLLSVFVIYLCFQMLAFSEQDHANTQADVNMYLDDLSQLVRCTAVLQN